MYIDIKYLSLVSSLLPFFKRKNETLWNFRCPMCGDSATKKSKARGYIYAKNSDLFYRCHNCDTGTTFSKLLAFVDPVLHKKYVMEKFISKRNLGEFSVPKFKSAPTPKKIDLAAHFNKGKVINIESIRDLPKGHWVLDWVRKREIPTEYYDRLFFAPDFKKFISETFGAEKAKDLILKEHRLVIPFYNVKNEIIAVQGRSLLNNTLRYITIKIQDVDKIFGLERLNPNSPMYIVEGPFDSLFLKNAIAVAGSELSKLLFEFPQATFIFDNEPWNKEIVANMEKVVAKNGKLVVWPSDLHEKDINDLVLAGKDPEKIIEENTYTGLYAKIKLSFWKKAYTTYKFPQQYLGEKY